MFFFAHKSDGRWIWVNRARERLSSTQALKRKKPVIDVGFFVVIGCFRRKHIGFSPAVSTQANGTLPCAPQIGSQPHQERWKRQQRSGKLVFCSLNAAPCRARNEKQGSLSNTLIGCYVPTKRCRTDRCQPGLASCSAIVADDEGRGSGTLAVTPWHESEGS